jgi:hypothetical protein
MPDSLYSKDIIIFFKYCIAVWQKQLISMAIFKNLLQNVPIDYNYGTQRFVEPCNFKFNKNKS